MSGDRQHSLCVNERQLAWEEAVDQLFPGFRVRQSRTRAYDNYIDITILQVRVVVQAQPFGLCLEHK